MATKVQGAYVELIVICAIVTLLSLGGLVWTVASGLISSGVDGLMMLFVCLMMAGVFGLEGIVLAKRAGWLEWAKLPRRKPALEAPATPPAAEKK
jgi:hypothetical protein